MQSWKDFVRVAFIIASVFAAILFARPPASAEVSAVRFTEGLARGFIILTDDRGKTIADGESSQVIEKGNVTSHLVIRFRDGSFYEDRTVYSQNGVFRLISDHAIQKGPSFRIDSDVRVDANGGEVRVESTDSKGRKKTLTKKMELPADLANGLIFTLVKDIDRRGPGATFSYLVASPQPRLVKLVFRPAGEDAFAAGEMRERANHIVMSVVIGGIAGVVAPLIGKKPPDADIWVLDDSAPSFAGFRGAFYPGGPVWTISLVSPRPLNPK